LRHSAIRPEIRLHRIEGQKLNQPVGALPQTPPWTIRPHHALNRLRRQYHRIARPPLAVIQRSAATKDLSSPSLLATMKNRRVGCPIPRSSAEWEVLRIAPTAQFGLRSDCIGPKARSSTKYSVHRTTPLRHYKNSPKKQSIVIPSAPRDPLQTPCAANLTKRAPAKNSAAKVRQGTASVVPKKTLR
jgi:hypothetical protein